MVLTLKQQRFIDEYLHDLNASQAMIRAGYRSKNPNVDASVLLARPSIRAAVDQRLAERKASSAITQEKVLAELRILSQSDPSHYMVGPLGNLVLAPGAPAGAMRAISSMKHKRTTIPGRDDGPPTVIHEVEFKLWDKPGMVKLAGRHAAVPGFADRVEHTGANGGPIQYENLSREEKEAKALELLTKAAERVE